MIGLPDYRIGAFAPTQSPVQLANPGIGAVNNPNGMFDIAATNPYAFQPQQDISGILQAGNVATNPNGSIWTGGGTPPPATGGIFDNMTGKDWMGVGAGALSAGLGAYFQNRQLKVGEGQLDLARDKYQTYLDDRARLQQASANRAKGL